ncbi:MAG: flagellar basal body protein FliL [Caulobacteraceae bacterium]|nr:flagellar basal body protein FliL [Caulobacteraceae bacterium]
MFGRKKKAKGDHGEAGGETAPAVESDPDALTLDGEDHGGKKKPPLMIILAAVGAVVVLGGGGTTAFLMLKKPAVAEAGKAPGGKAKKEKAKDDKSADGKKADAAQIKDGPDGVVFYTLPDVVVNMQTADGRPSFLKLKLTLELPDHDAADVLTPNMPRLQDMFQVFLRELRPEDLSGSQGGYQLRMEILRRVNLVIAPSKANAVLIEEMLVN